jgi:uncharacterized protein YndB with AHSA1/START domain
MAARVVSASRIIAASPEAIFEVLADPTKHPLIDGSGTVTAARSNPPRLSLGAKFSMDMKLGARYTTRNVVCEFEEGRRIAWHHVARFIWRYELEPVEGGTKVTESFDYSKPWGIAMIPFGVPERNRWGMERSLVLLDQLVTSGSAD